MDCLCESCKLVDVTSIIVTTDTSFVLNTDPKAFVNGKKYCLRICQCLPIVGESGIEPVTLVSNGITYPLLDSIGNVLLAGRLRGRKCYEMTFGDNVAHFLVCGTNKCLEYNANATFDSVPSPGTIAVG